MISSAFKGAVQSEVSSQGQNVSNAFQAPKDFASVALSFFGLKGVSAAAMSKASIGEAATQAITQEKMLAQVESQKALDNAFMRSIERADKAETLELTTVYKKLSKAKAERDAKAKLMNELKRGEEQ